MSTGWVWSPLEQQNVQCKSKFDENRLEARLKWLPVDLRGGKPLGELCQQLVYGFPPSPGKQDFMSRSSTEWEARVGREFLLGVPKLLTQFHEARVVLFSFVFFRLFHFGVVFKTMSNFSSFKRWIAYLPPWKLWCHFLIVACIEIPGHFPFSGLLGLQFRLLSTAGVPLWETSPIFPGRVGYLLVA